MGWARHVTRVGERRSAYGIFVRKRRHRWKDNIRMDLREIGWKGVDWMHVAQDTNQ
jgi:hypothetical protein